MGDTSEDPTSESSNEETLDIRVHLGRDGVWFCLVDTDEGPPPVDLEQIELRLSQADEENRIPDTLVRELEREEPAPVVGTVTHVDGEILDTSFDLQNWYPE